MLTAKNVIGGAVFVPIKEFALPSSRGDSDDYHEKEINCSFTSHTGEVI
jgi:hypothetical protein